MLWKGYHLVEIAVKGSIVVVVVAVAVIVIDSGVVVIVDISSTNTTSTVAGGALVVSLDLYLSPRPRGRPTIATLLFVLRF